MNVNSIYGPQTSPSEASQWLKNNPSKAQNPQLRQVADFNLSGEVDAIELSQAASNGTLILDGMQSFSILGEHSAISPQPEKRETYIQQEISVARASSSGVSKDSMALIGMAGSVAIGFAIGQKNPMLGIVVTGVGLLASTTLND